MPRPEMGLAHRAVVGIAIVVCPLATLAGDIGGDIGTERVSIALGGDVQHGRYRFRRWVTHAGPQPLAEVAALWRSADLMIANLENPLTDRDPPDIMRMTERPRRYIRLRGPTSAARALSEAGIDVATFANNHTLDCGRWGVTDTLAALAEAGIATAGASTQDDPLAPTVIDLGRVRVHVFAATRTSNRRVTGDSPLAHLSYGQMHEQLVVRVRAARAADPEGIVVVALHWGTEWSFSHDPPQTRLAHALVDAGAHIVVGHHPHLVQPVEIYRHGLILYSIGNLLFDQPSVSARQSVVARAELERVGSEWRVDAVRLRAIYRDLRRPGPEIAPESVRRKVLERVRTRSSRATGLRFRWDGDGLRWHRDPLLAVSEEE